MGRAAASWSGSGGKGGDGEEVGDGEAMVLDVMRVWLFRMRSEYL